MFAALKKTTNKQTKPFQVVDFKIQDKKGVSTQYTTHQYTRESKPEDFKNLK